MSLNFIKDTPEFKHLLEDIKQDQAQQMVTGVIDEAKPYFLSALSQELGRRIVLIRPSSFSLSRFAEECRYFLSQFKILSEICVLPSLSEDPYQDIPPSLETVASRMRCFYSLAHDQVGLVITNLFGLLKPFPAPRDMSEYFLEIEKGSVFARDHLLNLLSEYGYEQEDIINAHGEFAWRGGIVDVFSPWQSYPYRIEFRGDEVFSLREFEPSSQRSIRKVNRIVIPALREFPGTDEFLRQWEDLARGRAGRQFLTDLDNRLAGLRSGELLPSFLFLALIHQKHFVPFSKILKDVLFVIDSFEEVEKEWQETQQFLAAKYAEIRSRRKLCLAPEEIFSPSLWEHIKAQAVCWSELADCLPQKAHHFSFQSVPRFENKIPFFLEYLRKNLEERERCSIIFSSPGLRDRMAVLLSEHQISHIESHDPLHISPTESVAMIVGDLCLGFRYPPLKIQFFSEKDIFTEEKVLVSRPRITPFVSHFQDLKTDDYVVHADYGIGIFKGLIKMAVDEKNQEFIEILYRDEDKLFVPVEDLNLVQKYAKVGTSHPVLYKLGTSQWERTKERTIKAIEIMAKELLELYARRKAVTGHGFSPGGEWEVDFEKTFKYQETDDQLLAIKDVMKDMESSSSMDRLLCGDVGYGKTEVSMRAAFKAVMDGMQVAILCPTTVLASQHLNTFRNRMVLFPIRVEALTRLQSKAKQKEILKDLNQGLIDVLIGTHRMLSEDVVFRNLGLLVVDEEQRFGVKHKEKMKHLKANIDVLTMSATPIPRTLNLSLSNLRDISLIETPPKDRLAIHTIITAYNLKLIASAIRKELSRGGQVYFVHNRVSDIETIARLIQKMVPQAKVVTIHGQMAPPKLEKRMVEFIQGKYNVLVSTTIIENGIDIPLVNTLIVNRADKFGLSQLYQLRGRVGRSSRQAVAYFLVPPFSDMTPKSRERLKALREFSELGSGFRLAAKDLEIRGAGNFLGAKQHGFMESIGFDYYLHLLDKTIKKLIGEPIEDINSRINLKVDLRIPEDYLPQVNLRLNLYKRISSVEGLDELHRIREETIDRYGILLPSVKNLFSYGEVKYLAKKIKIKTIDRMAQKLVFRFFPDSSADLSRLKDLMKKHSGSITPQGVMTLRLSSQEEGNILAETISILKELSLI
jgi:transcription-repair coupling factor (superfamily II helicase)